jgi:type IV pilus biogenesis protein CpaD/CtpE
MLNYLDLLLAVLWQWPQASMQHLAAAVFAKVLAHFLVLLGIREQRLIKTLSKISMASINAALRSSLLVCVYGSFTYFHQGAHFA